MTCILTLSPSYTTPILVEELEKMSSLYNSFSKSFDHFVLGSPREFIVGQDAVKSSFKELKNDMTGF